MLEVALKRCHRGTSKPSIVELLSRYDMLAQWASSVRLDQEPWIEGYPVYIRDALSTCSSRLTVISKALTTSQAKSSSMTGRSPLDAHAHDISSSFSAPG